MIAVVAVYAPVLGFDFVHIDDDVYVTANRAIHRGLTLAGVRWALTTTHAGFWHPLTWLSHMLDCQLYGLRAGGHHLTSVLLHATSAVVLFAALRGLTGALWPSAVVAGLFAVHPLNVESVAWVAERKEVLSALFFFLTLWAYAAYARRAGPTRFALVAAGLTLALMAKPMAVTLPFVLLLLDYWPLARLRTTSVGTIVAEKLPLLGLATAAGIVTFVLQGRARALVSLEEFPFPARVANAAVSYARYVGKTFWPSDLAVFYPLPAAWTPWQIAGAVALLLGVTIFALRAARRQPYLLVGWLWFLGTLLPVIGLAQSGPQAMADRFAYIPIVGLFIMVTWGCAALVAGRPGRARILAACAGVVLATLAVACRRQLEHWRNSEALFTHALQVTGGTVFVHNNLGAALSQAGRTDEAIDHFAAALRLRPTDAAVQRNLGVALLATGRTAEAIEHLRAAVRLDPDDGEARNNLGQALFKAGRLEESLAQLSEAVRLQPGNARARTNLGVALSSGGRIGEAIGQLSEAVRLDPDLAEAHFNLALALMLEGDAAQAAVHRARALELKPELAARWR